MEPIKGKKYFLVDKERREVHRCRATEDFSMCYDIKKNPTSLHGRVYDMAVKSERLVSAANLFEDESEANAALTQYTEGRVQKYREEIAQFEDLLTFPLKHHLCGRKTNWEALRAYQEACSGYGFCIE